MLDQDVTIIRQQEDNRYDERGQRIAFVRIEFKVGTDGPFVERIDRDTYTASARDEKLNRFAREVRAPK